MNLTDYLNARLPSKFLDRSQPILARKRTLYQLCWKLRKCTCQNRFPLCCLTLGNISTTPSLLYTSRPHWNLFPHCLETILPRTSNRCESKIQTRLRLKKHRHISSTLSSIAILTSHSNFTLESARALICAGRILVNSGMATLSQTLADPLIVTDSPQP